MPPRKQKLSQDTDLDFDDEYGSESSSSGVKITQLLGELIPRWHWLALGLILGILGGFYYLSKAPKIYQARASLLIKLRASSIIKGTEDDDQLNLAAADSMNTVAQQASRVELLTKVASLAEVKALDDLIPPRTNWSPSWLASWLGSDDSDRKTGRAQDMSPVDLAYLIRSWLSVEVRSKTRLLDITISHPSPEVCKVLADAIAREYVDEKSSSLEDGQKGKVEVLTEKSQEAKRNLQGKQKALANYQQALEALRDLEVQELAFSKIDRRYLFKHPKHEEATKVLEDFQKRFLSEFESVRRSSVDKDYWEENRSELEQKDFQDGDRLKAARRLLTARATVLESEIQSEESIFNVLLTQLSALDVNSEDVEGGLVSSNEAQLPNTPSSPNEPGVLVAGSIIGFGGGLAFCLLLIVLDTRIHTVPQAEAVTGLPVLATIRDIQPKILAKIISEKGDELEALPPAAQKWDPRIVFRPGLSDTLYAEMFRILRASVTLLGDEKKRNVTLFSSAIPSEGKTLVSTNFAIASAQQGKKTVLIDLDLRKPAVHKNFGYTRDELGPGSTELLAGNAKLSEVMTEDTGQKNLTCIYSGAKAPNPGELLSSGGLEGLLNSLGDSYDVVVIDSAPLLAVPDTRLIIPGVDNFCLVVRAEQTPKGAIRKAIDLLEADGIQPSGIIVNAYEEKRALFVKKYRYGQGYGGYGGYGQYGKGYGYGGYGSYGSDRK